MIADAEAGPLAESARARMRPRRGSKTPAVGRGADANNNAYVEIQRRRRRHRGPGLGRDAWPPFTTRLAERRGFKVSWLEDRAPAKEAGIKVVRLQGRRPQCLWPGCENRIGPCTGWLVASRRSTQNARGARPASPSVWVYTRGFDDQHRDRMIELDKEPPASNNLSRPSGFGRPGTSTRPIFFSAVGAYTHLSTGIAPVAVQQEETQPATRTAPPRRSQMLKGASIELEIARKRREAEAPWRPRASKTDPSAGATRLRSLRAAGPTRWLKDPAHRRGAVGSAEGARRRTLDEFMAASLCRARFGGRGRKTKGRRPL